MKLKVKDIILGYSDDIVAKNISFEANSGEIISVLGPNGSGKSTLLKSMAGLINLIGGNILINDNNIKKWSWKERARVISYIPQTLNYMYRYSVFDIVLMGRVSYVDIFKKPTKNDIEIVYKSMEKLNILHLRDKIYSEISGGERQLVKIAQSLSQESKIILMDEPTSSLDFKNQLNILSYLKICSETGVIIVMATHFPEQALNYSDKVLLMDKTLVTYIDNPSINLTEDNLKRLYNIDMKIVDIKIKDSVKKICVI